VLVFYPFAFSAVCTDQFQVYQEALAEITRDGAEIYGVSTDASTSQTAFREKLGITIPQLSDFEPKGAMARAFGAYFEPGGMANRAIVVLKDGVVVWSWLGEHPGVLPGVNLVFDGLAAAQDS
jgi:peroxiredoxin (alkyl hydroperoxide reductase subunit C)